VNEQHAPPGWVTPARRRSPKLEGYDYTSPGVYFVTLCARAGRYPFGEVCDGEVRLSDVGRAIAQCWKDVPRHFQTVELDLYVVMPNHLHGLIALTEAADSLPPVRTRPSVHTVVGAFKSAATRRVNVMRNTPGVSLWQRTYYDHVVRTEQGLERIREYIANNPIRWEIDEENPERKR
jgi:REP element-mobilizing transposase RayT